MDEDPCKRDDDLHDAAYLRGRARDLRAAAASARDPEIAHALRQVAGDFDSEASREEAQLHGPPAAQRAAADS